MWLPAAKSRHFTTSAGDSHAVTCRPVFRLRVRVAKPGLLFHDMAGGWQASLHGRKPQWLGRLVFAAQVSALVLAAGGGCGIVDELA